MGHPNVKLDNATVDGVTGIYRMSDRYEQGGMLIQFEHQEHLRQT